MDITLLLFSCHGAIENTLKFTILACWSFSETAVVTNESRLDQMKFHVEVVLACVVGFITIQQSLCDETSNISGIKDWTCECSSSYQGNQSYTVGSNCSTSCNCSQDVGSIWRCKCPADGLPKVAADSQYTNCFAACNCTFGSLTDTQSSKKHVSSKVVVFVLLICVILTTLAILSSVACYFYRKDKSAIQPPMFSSDRETSFNSATMLISRKSYSLPETKTVINSPVKQITGCFHRRSCLPGSRTGTIHGVIVQFTYSELHDATDNFSKSNLIGIGGSSYVYRGALKDGKTVAIKRLKTQKRPDADSVFLTEIDVLSRLNHCHVVPLVGYCSESRGKHAERLLVFEYIPNGNLRDCLDGASGKKMDWSTRVGIAIGAARGLEYLHEAAAPRILHRDVKSTNILLDEEWRAKITDLGMAKHLRADGHSSCSNSPARVEGTFGYFAPEYAIVGRASLKSDVFSFGVVLLELITGQPPIRRQSGKGEESLVIWATPRLQDSRRIIMELPDPNLHGKFPEEEMQIMTYLAKECLQLDPEARPTMGEVQILSTIAPDRSRRTNFSVNFSQRSSTCGTHSEESKDMPDCSHISKQNVRTESSEDAEELKQVVSYNLSGPCSLPLDVNDTAIHVEDKEEKRFSAEYMERLVLLASKARSWRVSDNETVDLTEPRFESFCMVNAYPP